MAEVIEGLERISAIPPDLQDYGAGKNLIIVASGRTMWEDYRRVQNWPADVMAVNHTALLFAYPVQHVVSLHGDLLYPTAILRDSLIEKRGGEFRRVPTPGTLYHGRGWNDHPFDQYRQWDPAITEGGSGLFALKAGLLMGYEKVVLCGMGYDADGHFYDPPWGSVSALFQVGERGKADYGKDHGMYEWVRVVRLLGNVAANKVRSDSGRTKEWFGSVSEDWLNG